jgi:hypothetical protein
MAAHVLSLRWLPMNLTAQLADHCVGLSHFC